MVYTKNTWVDDDPTKPLSAARLNNLETQYDQAVVTAASDASNKIITATGPKTIARISITHKTDSVWGAYAVVEARSGGFAPGSSVIGKRYAYDFDITNPTSTGTAFTPSPEHLDSYANRTGYNVVSNASGWYIYDSNPRMMRGAQIRNSLIYHDFEATNLDNSPAGIEGLGLSADGHLRCYSALRGDTAATMVASGVTDSWSYGPNLVVNGVAQDLTTKNWQYFLTDISARTIIGQRANGDVVIISTVGKTGIRGITGNDMVTLAQSEGLYNASLFDGGGSAQIYAEGFYTIPSSDLDGPVSAGTDGTFGRRGVGDAFMLKGILTTAPLDTGWRTVTLRSGYTSNGGATPQVRTLNGTTELRGRVQRTSGNFLSDGSSEFIGDLPQQFGHETTSKGFLCPGDSANYRKVTIQADRSIQIVGTTINSPAYIVLDGIRWGTQTI
jgi:exopolysaccharide biosynthesis protein